MRSSLARYAVCWLAIAACADGPGGETPRTDETSQELLSSARPDEAGPASEVPPGIAAPRQQANIDIAALGFDRGSHEAPVRVIEMSDYGCGYCRKFHEETWPVLREQFVDAGKIEWKFLPFVSGMFKNSSYATRAAECAMEQGPDVFEAMNARIWNDQKEWKGSGDPAPTLRSYAGDVGADLGRYDSCLAEGRRDQRVSAATSLAHQVGVRGTPTFFVVGYPPLQGALPTEAFQQVLTMVYADATGAGGR
jgi:protein-disulfide isomerase